MFVKKTTINAKPVQYRLCILKIKPAPSLIALLLVMLLAPSCSDEDDGPKRVVLVEATSIISRTASELQSYLKASPINIDETILQYDVEVFRVKYKTKYKGSDITASGIVVLPKTTDEVPMTSFQHGTIVAQAEAPSALLGGDLELILYAALSSAGFIAVIPDFIGFGDSKLFFHPYYVEEATATAVIDNLKAAKELAAEKNVKFNKRLFLAGYSQGGYATMAAHKSIETTPLSDFDLIASFPASGGYDVKGMQEYFFSQDTYNQPYYMAYVALSYKSYYSWNENVIGQFFKDPYASRIPSLFNGTNDSGVINSQLTNSIPDLVNDDLLDNIESDPQYSFLVDAFNENSLLDWKPTKKMFMYHGDADVTVPYQNSVDTYNYFIDQGASPNTVSLRTIEGADHGSGVYPYLEDMFDKLMVLK
jgi:pimeloyl-ACP methyl ester carboxylesterase